MCEITLRGVTRRYTPHTLALAGIDLDVPSGQALALVGPSGSGKSTLIHLLAGIDRPDSGSIHVGGVDLGSLDEAGLTRWRGRQLGLVFQSFQLLPGLTALENVLLPMELCGRGDPDRARALLGEFGVADQADKLPADMSGGQQQRVAIARALANDPPLVIADEPTGNLDSANGEHVLRSLAALAGRGRTVVLVTHDPRHRRWFDRSVSLCDGRVVDA